MCIWNHTTISVVLEYRGNSVETKIFDLITASNKSRLMFCVFFWTEPHPKACTDYFAVLLALKHWCIQVHYVEYSASSLLGSSAGTGSAFPWPAGGRNAKFLEWDWNLEHRNTLKECMSGKENFSVCLIRCWHSLTSAFGFPQPQESLFSLN